MEEIIREFIKKNDYQNDNDVLEIIYYGSTKYKTNNKSSDIDLLIITNNTPNQKGVVYISGQKIEFHIKNITTLIDEIEQIERDNDNSLFSVFNNGTPLLRKTNLFEDIREELSHKKISHKKVKRRSELVDFYERYRLSSGNIRNYFFHNTLEEIRKKYQEENGYSKIQVRKVKMLYTDKDYARKYYCVNLPNDEFIKEYLSALDEDESLIDTLYSKISYKEGYEYSQYGNNSKRFIIFYSTHINSELEKLSSFFEEDKSYYNHFYYIVLEKIRRLYANKVRIDIRIRSFPTEYEDTFLELFYECINTKSLESIYKLFRYIVEDYNIDYKDYKVLEY